jgi:ankyrin repeat protein
MNNQKEIIKLLIQNGADINIKNRFGRTALDLAFYKNFKDLVELLKKYGATE